MMGVGVMMSAVVGWVGGLWGLGVDDECWGWGVLGLWVGEGFGGVGVDGLEEMGWGLMGRWGCWKQGWAGGEQAVETLRWRRGTRIEAQAVTRRHRGAHLSIRYTLLCAAR